MLFAFFAAMSGPNARTPARPTLEGISPDLIIPADKRKEDE
ncbi:hypothetical protein [Nonomuraea sp. NPDC049695]